MGWDKGIKCIVYTHIDYTGMYSPFIITVTGADYRKTTFEKKIKYIDKYISKCLNIIQNDV